MKTVYITVGVSASGKTSWANEMLKKNPEFSVLCRDDIRKEILENKNKKFLWSNWKWKWEKDVTRIFNEKLIDLFNEDKSFIIADTNLNKKRLEDMMMVCVLEGYNVETKYFPISYEEAVRRDSLRENSVGSSVIAKQLDQWNSVYVENWNKKNNHLDSCVIFDIDGTVARHDTRTAYEWKKVKEDGLIVEVANLVYMYYGVGYKIIFLSGRDGVCFNDTMEWLKDKFPEIEFDLFMRPKDDNRPDTEIKEELFMKNIYKKYNVECVFDDRPRIVRMWRSHGLFSFAVGNQHIEF